MASNVLRMFLESDIDNCGSSPGFEKRNQAIKFVIQSISDFNLESKATQKGID